MTAFLPHTAPPPARPVRAAAIVAACWLGLASGPMFAQLPGPLDCAAAAGDPEPGTPEWHLRDAGNVLCGTARAADIALHPVAGLPTLSALLTVLPEQSDMLQPVGDLGPLLTLDAPPGDPYRAPERHEGQRFRFEELTLTSREGAAIAVELYRPCTGDTCAGMPEALHPVDPPYPGIVVVHGGGSRKELTWWASQPLAEAGYMVAALQVSTDHQSDAEDVVDWLLATPDAPTASGEHNPYWSELDRNRIGIAGHSRGGQVSSVIAQLDPRIGAVVAWDRGASLDLPERIDTPALFFVADYECQSNPICLPEPYDAPPDPEVGPGDAGRGREYDIVQAAGVDTMKIVLRAATHLDWTPPLVTGSQYGEIVSVYYTLAWFDRYLKGSGDSRAADNAFARLIAPVFDDSADRHNISQGFYDPAAALTAADPYAGNAPYRLEGMPVEDRLSFYFHSKCDIAAPDGARARSQNMRADGCSIQAGSGSGSGSASMGLLLFLSLILAGRRALPQRNSKSVGVHAC